MVGFGIFGVVCGYLRRPDVRGVAKRNAVLAK
jgi:hypothetical protein